MWTGIIFDLDGVLVDSSPCHERAYRDLFNLVGIAPVDYLALAGRRTRDVVASLLSGPSDDLAALVAFKQQCAYHYLCVEDVAMPGALPLLAGLARSGVPIGVATGASRRTARLLLERCGLATHVTALVSADDVSRGKPDPETFLQACSRLRLAPRACLMVEDSRMGLQAARASGGEVVAVHGEAAVAREQGVARFESLDALGEWIERRRGTSTSNAPSMWRSALCSPEEHRAIDLEL